MSNGDSGVRFTDGFDRPDTLAFGLEAPQLAVAVGGALLSWGVLRSSAPALLTVPAAVTLALAAAVIGCGRWAGRPLLTWAWLAARFLVRPRSGATLAGLLLSADGEHPAHPGEVTDVAEAPVAGRAAAQAGSETDRPSAQALSRTGKAGRGDQDEPPWARWLRDGGAPPPDPAGIPAPPDAEPSDSPPPTPSDDVAGPAAQRERVSPEQPRPAATGGRQSDPPRRWWFGRAAGRRSSASTFGGGPPRSHASAPPSRAPAPTAPPSLGGGRILDRERVPLVLLPEPLGAAEDGSADADRPPPLAGASASAEGAPTTEATVIPLRPAPPPVDDACLTVAEAAPAPPLGEPSRPQHGDVPYFAGATRRIAFFSLNGGAGCTTLATEVACLLAARGRHRDVSGAARPLGVALLDLDLRSANVAIRLGIPQPTLLDYLVDGGGDPGALDRYLVDHRSGLRALLGPPKPMSGAVGLEPARVAEIVHRLERAGTHFLVFDVGADLGAVSTWVLSAVHDIFVVITATAVGIQDAYRTTEQLRRLGLGHKLHYVVNRARTNVDVSEVMGDLGGRITASIPYDPRVEEAENHHRCAALEGRGPAADGLALLAAAIYPPLGPQPRRTRVGMRGWRRVG